jgi:hypothetical protein
LVQVLDVHLAPADLAGAQVAVCATDRLGELADLEGVELGVQAAGELEVGRRVDGHEDRVEGRVVVEAGGRRVGVRCEVEDVSLREAGTRSAAVSIIPPGIPFRSSLTSATLWWPRLSTITRAQEPRVLADDPGVRADQPIM